jgi:hypothetical protein
MRAKTNNNGQRSITGLALSGLCVMVCATSHAAEGFKIRYPLAGSVAAEMVAPVTPGLFGSAVVTHADINKITGNDGKSLTGSITAGGAPRTVQFGFNQQQNIVNLILGYTTTQTFANGHLTAVINLPYSTIDRSVNATSSFGPLADTLATLSSAASGQTEGVGDIEVSGIWARQTAYTKLTVGMTLILPTGAYDKDPKAINISNGNFYTLRPSASFSYKATDNLTVGARASLGFNTKNTENNNWRSGDFYAVDLAAAYKTPIGMIGPQILRAEQYKDDVNATSVIGGSLGANRYSSTGAGAFFSTRLEALDASLNMSVMKMIESKNALSGTLTQVRIFKAF